MCIFIRTIVTILIVTVMFMFKIVIMVIIVSFRFYLYDSGLRGLVNSVSVSFWFQDFSVF